jgi:hypothetical protein
MLNPPKKALYLAPMLLWLIGFFVVMAFVGKEKLSSMMALLAVGYILFLLAYFSGALYYNLLLRPQKVKAWEGKFICNHCGTVV